MSCNVSCVDVCRAVSWHDILYLHGTTWGMSCNVSCHVVEFGDVDSISTRVPGVEMKIEENSAVYPG